MILLNTSVARFVSGGSGEFVFDAADVGGGGGGGGGDGGGGGGCTCGASPYDGTAGGGAWEAGWPSADAPEAPSEGHLAFDTALAGAVGARTGMAVEGFTGAALIAAGVAGTIALPIAAIGGLVVGGYAFVKAKEKLAH